MRDAVYLNPISNYKQWYTTYEYKNEGKTIVRLNTGILTKAKTKSVNGVALPYRDPIN